MNELKIFESKEFGKVRTVDVEGKIYFVGSDVAKALGYAKPSNAVSQYCPHTLKHGIGVQTGEKSDGTPAIQKIEMLIIPEGDLYRLISRSQLPAAEKFESWVFDEVLPTIRKHGIYATDITIEKMLDDPDTMIKTLEALKHERTLRLEKERIIELQKPKVIFADAVEASIESILIRDFSKLLSKNNIMIGEKRLYEWMRRKGFIQKTANRPTQKSVELGVLELKESVRFGKNNELIPCFTTKVTGKGQTYFMNKFLLEG